MGRRHDEERTRQNRTRQYPGGYERRGPPDEGFYGPYYDRRGNKYFEDSRGARYYDEDFREPYYRDHEHDSYERDRYERDRRQHNTGRTATRGLVMVAVALVVLVSMILVTNDLSGGPDSAQQAPGDLTPQEQPVAPQQPQAPSPQTPAQPQAPQPDGASAEQVEGLRADLERQLAEIRSSINQLRLEIWSFFGSQQNQQQEQSP